jgi:hypothetical protein
MEQQQRQQNGPKHPELWEKARQAFAGPDLGIIRLITYMTLCRRMGLEP